MVIVNICKCNENHTNTTFIAPKLELYIFIQTNGEYNTWENYTVLI